MEDLFLYVGATLALRYARLALFGRPERRLQQHVSESSHRLCLLLLCATSPANSFGVLHLSE